MNDKLIKIGDKTYKEAQVIMLPTEVKEPNFTKGFIVKQNELYPYYNTELRNKIGRLCISKNNLPGVLDYNTPQHLYIVTSEEIKEEDWVYDILNNNFFKIRDSFFKEQIEELNSSKSYFKIIASTDPSFNLPKPSSDFIKKFVKSKGDIKDVLVEYEELKGDFHKAQEDALKRTYIPDELKFIIQKNYKLKVAPDNTISIIKKPEDRLYTREEMEYSFNAGSNNKEGYTFDYWIKTHIKK